MDIKLMNFSKEDILNKLYTACRTCYNTGSPIDMYEEVDSIPEDKKVKLIQHVLSSQHMSVLEHATVTIMIEGVSRALTHQLVRHRMCSHSQQSQRYCEFKEGVFEYVTPKTISKDDYLRGLYEGTMSHLSDIYSKLIEAGVPAEDARMILPNACCTNIVTTVNLRELIHMCNERLCTCAQWEIRDLFREIARAVSGELDFIKGYLQPKCERDGYCSESSKRTCGRKRLKGEILENGRCSGLPRVEEQTES